LKKEFERALELSAIGVAYTGSSISVGQYLVGGALDELLVFLAKQQGNEETQRLTNFVTGHDQFINVLSIMNKENYLDVSANWKFAGDSNLHRTLHTLYSNQLSDNEYKVFQEDLSKAHSLSQGATTSLFQVLGDRLLPADYKVISSSSQEKKTNLSHRKNTRSFLYSSVREDKPTDEINLQQLSTRNNPRL
jgi:hypothetical protein